MLDKILNLFKVKSLYQLIVVFIVFAITGSLSLYLSNPIINSLNFNFLIEIKILFYVVRLIILFLTYQLLLIIIGSIFGQFSYFWNFEKKIINRFRILKKLSFSIRNYK
jgi:hypothetical protein